MGYNGIVIMPATLPVRETPRARVIRSLRHWIEEGRLPAGHPLPSARALAEEFVVDRATVNKALETLDAEGLIHSNGRRLRIVSSRGSEGDSHRPGLFEHVIAIVTPDTQPPRAGHRQSGWREYLTQGTLEMARASGMHALALNPALLHGGDLSRLLVDRPYGVIITEQAPHTRELRELYSRLQESGIPTVAYGDGELLAAFDRVSSDHEAGGYELTRFLLSTGRKRPVNVWPEETGPAYWLLQRQAGYERAMREAGIEPLEPVLVPLADEPVDSFDRKARRYVGFLAEHLTSREPSDAILAASDGQAFHIAAACGLLNLRVHEDVAIVGYDNYYADSPEREHLPFFPLATVDKGNRKLGSELVNLLMDRVAGRLPAEPQSRHIEPDLIVVDQSAKPPIFG